MWVMTARIGSERLEMSTTEVTDGPGYYCSGSPSYTMDALGSTQCSAQSKACRRERGDLETW